MEVKPAEERRSRSGLLARGARALHIRPGEGSAVAWTSALFAVSQASQGLGANTADTLFFFRFGVEFLPTMILISGPVVMVGILIHAAGLGRAGARRWLPVALVGSAGILALERLGILFDVAGIYPVVWLLGQTVMLVSFTSMWNAAGAVCDTRQAKRLYPLFASAGIAGGIVGNAATGPLATLLGTENLLLVQAALLLGSGGLAAAIGRWFMASGDEGTEGTVLDDFRAGLSVTMQSRHLRIVAGVAVALGVLFFMVVFPFSEVVTESFPSEEEVAGYLGAFSAVATAVTFLVSLLVTNRLFARLGVVATLIAVPLVYLGGFALWLVTFGLVTATLVRGLQFVSVNAIGATAWSSLFNVLPSRRRGQVMAFMAAGPTQLGTTLSGILLLAGAALPQGAQILLGVTIAAITVGLVVRMRRAYGDALVGAVQHGLLGVFTTPTEGIQKPALDADVAGAMALCLRDPRPEARVMAVTTFGRMGGSDSAEFLVPALGDEEARVRAAALEALAYGDGTAVAERLDSLVRDPDPRIRRRALELARRQGLPPTETIRDALDDPVAEVVAMAATIVGGDDGRRRIEALVDRGDPLSVTAALLALELRPELGDGDLTHLLGHSSQRVRAAAARALTAAGGGRPEEVGPLLDDASLLTRRAAASSLAESEEGLAFLLQVLEHGSVRASDAALRALVQRGKGGEDLARWAVEETARAAFLRRHRLDLEHHTHLSPAGSYLVRLLRIREERLERWSMMALTTPETEEAMAAVARGIWSSDSEVRSQALEALDTIGDRSVVQGLLPLLEEEPHGREGDPRSSLIELSSDLDYWIRALALRCLRDISVADLVNMKEIAEGDPSPLVRSVLSGWEAPTMYEADTLDIMERVLAIQQIPIFSEIDPEDLERIAQVTLERHYDAEELIYREGDEGDEMLLIISGEVAISRVVDGENVYIRSYGTGNHVGELALLRGQPRSSDVTAGSESVHALVLESADFQAILEERPGVAMAMLGTLAERLATM